MIGSTVSDKIYFVTFMVVHGIISACTDVCMDDWNSIRWIHVFRIQYSGKDK